MKQIKITEAYFYKPNKYTAMSSGYFRNYATHLMHKCVYGNGLTPEQKEELPLIVAEYDRRRLK